MSKLCLFASDTLCYSNSNTHIKTNQAFNTFYSPITVGLIHLLKERTKCACIATEDTDSSYRNFLSFYDNYITYLHYFGNSELIMPTSNHCQVYRLHEN